MISFTCIYCGRSIQADEDTAGENCKCPECNHELKIPWTLKGRPAIGGTKIETIEDDSPASKHTLDLLSEKKSSFLPDEKPPAFDVKTLFGEKPVWFIPTYDEQSLFLIAVTLLLVVLSNEHVKYVLHLLLNSHKKTEFFTSLTHTVILGTAMFLFIPFVIILPGLFLSLYHIFSKRKKSRTEKHLMMLFAVVTNAVIGIAAGAYVIRQCPVWLLIFPVWNILNFIVILTMLDARVVNETCIIEDKTTLARVAVGLITTIVIFALCNYVFKLYWAVTFSICIIYTTNFEKVLLKALTRKTKHVAATE